MRVLAAAGYELLALFALLFLAAVPWVLAMPGQQVPSGNRLFQIYLLLVLNGYFSAGWVYGGQTLGMRAWRLFVVSDSATPLTWGRAIIRFWVAIVSWAAFGLGIAWLAFTGRSWHDLASGTRVVHRPEI